MPDTALTPEAAALISHVVDDGRGGKVDHFVVPTQVGWLVAYRSGDPGSHDEISVDLVTPDGHAMQLSVTGYDCHEGELDPPFPGYRPLHVLFWDGHDADAPERVDVTTDEAEGFYR